MTENTINSPDKDECPAQEPVDDDHFTDADLPEVSEEELSDD